MRQQNKIQALIRREFHNIPRKNLMNKSKNKSNVLKLTERERQKKNSPNSIKIMNAKIN